MFYTTKNVNGTYTLWIENFDEIALSNMVKEIQAILCFVIFGKNSKIQNGCHFWGGENFLNIANNTFLRYPVGRKFRRNRSLAHVTWLRRYNPVEQFCVLSFCVLSFLAKIRKFKMAAIFGEGKIFLKIANSTFLRYPVGRKFRRNRSISHS